MHCPLAILGLVITLTMQAADSPYPDRVVFDFSHPSAAEWQIVNDTVMGGRSVSRFELTPTHTAVFQGEVSLENSGGFASVRSPRPEAKLTGCRGFVIRIRGDGKRYKFAARQDTSSQAPVYQCTFSTRAGEWQEHRFQLGQFVPSFRGRTLTDQPPLDPGRLVSVGFLISDEQAGSFRLEIDWIKALSPTPPESAE